MLFNFTAIQNKKGTSNLADFMSSNDDLFKDITTLKDGTVSAHLNPDFENDFDRKLIIVAPHDVLVMHSCTRMKVTTAKAIRSLGC